MKKLLIALVGIVAVIAIIGVIAPKDFKIEREVVINKPKDQVFAYLKSLKNGSNWNPWIKLDPNIVIDYKGEDGAVGSISSWSGNEQVGVGEQEIKDIREGEKIDFDLRFKKPMESKAIGYFTTESVGENQTKVKWGMMGETGFPFNIVCLVMGMTKNMNKDFDKGLANLKSILEAAPTP